MLLQRSSLKKTVELNNCFNTASGRCCCNKSKPSASESTSIVVSIPQAVGAVATLKLIKKASFLYSFNTASGRCCCNVNEYGIQLKKENVSIPQAVGAVATVPNHSDMEVSVIRFQYRKR